MPQAETKRINLEIRPGRGAIRGQESSPVDRAVPPGVMRLVEFAYHCEKVLDLRLLAHLQGKEKLSCQ